MKAIVYNEYGSPDVLHISELEKPTPKANEIRVRVQATSVNFGDLLARNMKAVTPGNFTMPFPLWLLTRLVFGWNKPKKQVLGALFAGDVESVGNDVTRFKVGDPVFGYLGATMGAYAEYICMAEDANVVAKPHNMSYEEASTVPYGAIMAVPILHKVNIQPGQKVLINGASGAIGSIAVQLAKHYGAEVTGVCGTPRMDFVKSLGADHVIDYTQEDFTQNSETYDVIFDVLGKSSFSACKNSLTPNGVYLLVSFKTGQILQMLWTSMFGSQKVICGMSPEKRDDLVFAKDLIEAGKIKTVVDRCYPLEQASDAHRYSEAGHRKGHVVITVA